MKLGIDIGGTFTDLVLLYEDAGNILFVKTLTTYPDPSVGIMNGVMEILAKAGIEASQIDTIVHGTTLVTNAVIERKGAKTGLLTTKGFEDVLEIGRELRYDIYDIFLEMPKPLINRDLRLGVSERLDRNGAIVQALDLTEAEAQLQVLAEKGVQSVAVCTLHAFANPSHEQAIGDLLKKRFPQFYFSLSSEVMPEIREYERCSATAMNAYVQPITDHYLQKLEASLQELGFGGKIHIMISSGRLTTVAGARKTPIQLLESGPAGGTMASVFFGKLLEQADLLAFDMGGTTAKASLINRYQPEVTNQFEAGRVRRFKKGSGLPVRIPVIDMIEIGAGGGSIARVNHLVLLTVGPDSAASQPGPACYGRGGEEPTVTDADLVLGYLNAAYFLGGEMPLDLDLAKTAIQNKLAEPLGISVEEAALGVHRIVNENMANAARVHILEKGLDPRRYSMIAFGGAGPVHAFQVARLLHSPRLIIPVAAGVASALGFLVSPVASEQMKSYVRSLDKIDWNEVNAFLNTLEKTGLDFLTQAGIPLEQASIRRMADMRYVGQGHEIIVNIPNGLLDESSKEIIENNFRAEYELRYSRGIESIPMETVTWRVVVSGPDPVLLPKQMVNSDGDTALKGQRPVWFPGIDHPVSTRVYDRYALQSGDAFAGPAIIEEMESTTVIGPDCRVQMDDLRNLIIDMIY
jgi:N-methylhydantoinase A